MHTSLFDRSLIGKYALFMKRCKDCGAEKPLDQFYTYKHSDKVTHYARCKTCHGLWKRSRVTVTDRRKHRQNHRANAIARLNELKARPCKDCKRSYPPYVMDFDHLGDDKFTNLAKMVGRYSWAKILEEVEKCELVCSNCHRIRTWNRKNERQEHS